MEPLCFRQRLAFGTVTVSAGIILVFSVSAVIALIDMTTQFRRPAGDQRVYHLPLGTTDVPQSGNVVPENIGDF
jgi:hypothetical protein